ncbi:MAG: cytochrome c maturation protein CcmE [Anaerolineales bacterium]|nr:cytochrome c maturation protein CcmE [Anaerolineales bacterium]
MTQTTVSNRPIVRSTGAGRSKFLIGGLLVIGAIAYLIVTTMQSTAQYFYTVEEIRAKGSSIVGQNLRASGAVLGDTITYDPATLTITFEMAHVTADNREIEAQGGLAAALHNAVSRPDAPRLKVVYVGPKPDLLQHEAQAIVTGKLGEDGVFYADELLLKCPTRYDEAVPKQAEGGPGG